MLKSLNFLKKTWLNAVFERKKTKPKHLILGKQGEKIALKFLKKQGYKILELNWQSGHYEIDLICLHDEYLVFVEVKTSETSLEQALFAFHQAKQQNLTKAVNDYLLQKKLWHLASRIDLICVYGCHKKLEHYQNVISFEQSETCQKGQIKSGGNSTWQPW